MQHVEFNYNNVNKDTFLASINLSIKRSLILPSKGYSEDIFYM